MNHLTALSLRHMQQARKQLKATAPHLFYGLLHFNITRRKLREKKS